MDVAWGANSGDENPDAVQTASTAQSGEIFEQHYTPWTGQLNPRWMRNWSIPVSYTHLTLPTTWRV